MPNTIEQGATGTFAATGANVATSPRTWEIRWNGTVIAHNTDTQGWNVSTATGNSLIVSAPEGATVSPSASGIYTENYEARLAAVGLIETEPT